MLPVGPTERLPISPVAVTFCADAEPVAGVMVVRAESRLPVIGSGEAGPVPPAVAFLHSGWAALAVIGDWTGEGPRPMSRTLASQFHGLAEAAAGSARPPSAAIATSIEHSFFKTRPLTERTSVSPESALNRSTPRPPVRRRGPLSYTPGGTKRPSASSGAPSIVSRPPSRRSQMRSQCSALAFLPPVSG